MNFVTTLEPASPGFCMETPLEITDATLPHKMLLHPLHAAILMLDVGMVLSSDHNSSTRPENG
eukprot:5513660-Lingulodinium_polyedra.AAC.1